VADAIIGTAQPIMTGVAGRYATALFDLARDGKLIDEVAASLARLGSAINESSDFRALIRNPLVSRDQSARAIAAMADVLKLESLAARFLGVLAQNRRLGALPDIIRAFQGLVSHFKGETTAQVVSARPLSADQLDALKKKLRAGLGKDVAIEPRVDPNLLGGLIVKIGSRMIDSSLKTKLDTLSLAMKG
jgi:F-type H+-transporting ATPase subunit delta